MRPPREEDVPIRRGAHRVTVAPASMQSSRGAQAAVVTVRDQRAPEPRV